MTISLEKLKELAEKATPGPWEVEHVYELKKWRCAVIYVGAKKNNNFICGNYDEEGGVCSNKADADFISAANPDTILKLIKIIESQDEALNARLPTDQEAMAQARKICNYDIRSDHYQAAGEIIRFLEGYDWLRDKMKPAPQMPSEEDAILAFEEHDHSGAAISTWLQCYRWLKDRLRNGKGEK